MNSITFAAELGSVNGLGHGPLTNMQTALSAAASTGKPINMIQSAVRKWPFMITLISRTLGILCYEIVRQYITIGVPYE